MKTILLLALATGAFVASLPAADPPQQERRDSIIGRLKTKGAATIREITIQEALEKSGLPMTKVESVLSTNWLALSLEKASGTGPVVSVPREIGILISNRYAVVIADNSTNRILLSSVAILPAELLLRDPPPEQSIWLTNFMTPRLSVNFTNAAFW